MTIQAKFQVELYSLILNLVSEEFKRTNYEQDLKIASDIYNGWIMSDINTTLEVINENMCQ
ncbi:hypothetical protein VYP57_11350 [Streptococcus agalactiae]